MTIWAPDLSSVPGPRYKAIAAALAADIRAGTLTGGTRLPTHRDLAWRLGVTVGTVSRAYAEAERLGLIAGEVGRGTFVRGAPALAWQAAPSDEGWGDAFIDLSFNFAMVGGEAAALAQTVARLAAGPNFADLLHYQPSGGRPADRAAGAQWLQRCLVPATAERVVVTNGGQHSLATIFTVLTRPGDIVATESLTYPGMKALANLIGLRLLGLAIDEEGLLPDAFEAACRAGGVKVLYTMPTLHNPTVAMLPLERRRAIAAIARRHGVLIVEDDVFGFLAAPPLTPIASLVPELCFYVSAASKSMAPGLRIGYVHAPAPWVDRLIAAMRATTYMTTPLMAAIASLWIVEGTADQLTAAKRAAMRLRRERIAARLGDAVGTAATAASHLWLHLPPSWRDSDFVAEARRRGVGLTASGAFVVGRAPALNAVRLCYGTPVSDGVLDRALSILAELIDEGPGADLAVV